MSWCYSSLAPLFGSTNGTLVPSPPFAMDALYISTKSTPVRGQRCLAFKQL